MAASGTPEFDIMTYWRILRRRFWLVLLCPLVTGAVAYLQADSQPRLFASSAEILVARTQAETLFDPLGNSLADPSRLLANQARLVQGSDVQARARQRLGFSARISASFSATDDVLVLSAVNRNPKRAADTVNAYVESYIDYRRESGVQENRVAQDEVRRQLSEIEVELKALDSALAAAPAARRESLEAEQGVQRDRLISQRAGLQTQMTQLQAAVNVNRGGAELLAPAVVPTRPFEPQPRRSGSLGLVVGAMVGLALALGSDLLDDRIRTRADIDRVDPRLPVLGFLPAVPGWKRRQEAHVISIEAPASVPAEAYRTLRTSVQFLGLDKPLQVLQITSPAAAEGKTTTCANLAVALARAGQRVVVVDCDLRRPRLHEFFGFSRDLGFTSVVLGDIPLSAALLHVPGVDRLRVIPAGPVPPNPSELLSGHRVVEILSALRADNDVVLIDSPPVLPVSDAAALSASVDGTLLVLRSNKTRRKQLTRSLELLKQVDATVVGAVLNGGTEEGDDSYSRYYDYAELPRSPAPKRWGRKRVGADAGART